MNIKSQDIHISWEINNGFPVNGSPRHYGVRVTWPQIHLCPSKQHELHTCPSCMIAVTVSSTLFCMDILSRGCLHAPNDIKALSTGTGCDDLEDSSKERVTRILGNKIGSKCHDARLHHHLMQVFRGHQGRQDHQDLVIIRGMAHCMTWTSVTSDITCLPMAHLIRDADQGKGNLIKWEVGQNKLYDEWSDFILIKDNPHSVG